MRPRRQAGQVFKRGKVWVLRYWEDQTRDGAPYRARVTKILGSTSEYRTQSDAENRAAVLMVTAGVNVVSKSAPDSAMTLGDFIEHRYFPQLEGRLTQSGALHLEPSTLKGYRDIWRFRVENDPVVKVRLRDFTAADAQQFFSRIDPDLTHQSHLRIRAFLSGVFTSAAGLNAFEGAHPIQKKTKVGGRTKKQTTNLTERERKIQASNTHAYTLEEVAEMLNKLPEPARTVCAVAAFTGLTRSELPALKWADYDGTTINVQRKVWNGLVGAPKTESREAGVYVIGLLRKILTKYKQAFPPMGDDGWIFRGEKLQRPLSLDNLSRRDIPQYIDGAWFGWHAFRRGLGTRLNEAGVDDKDIQSILRHADISTTQAFYILPSQERAKAGLKKLEKMLRVTYGIKA
jgi:integrase